jgi:hypothetical protein
MTGAALMAPTDDQRRAYAEAYARALAEWGDAIAIMMHGEPRPPEVEAVASVLGLDPEALWDHVEGEHGWEPHDEGFEDAVWTAAACDDPEHLKEAGHG